MAGVKGKSGGPRPNSGGTRAGAGRKPRVALPKSANGTASVSVALEPQPRGGALKRSKAVPVPVPDMDMLQLLQDIALGKTDASTVQVRAAIAAVQYTHIKKGDGGIKDQKQDAAKKAGAGKYGSAEPPKLAAANGKRL
jgi:hypothetical protein